MRYELRVASRCMGPSQGHTAPSPARKPRNSTHWTRHLLIEIGEARAACPDVSWNAHLLQEIGPPSLQERIFDRELPVCSKVTVVFFPQAKVGKAHVSLGTRRDEVRWVLSCHGTTMKGLP